MANQGIVWTGDLTDKVNQFGPRVKRAMVAGAKYIAPQAEAHMKDNAPWTDRTSNARNGLSTEVVIEANRVTILLFHTVPYGPYLELRWSGRYQIINPTIELFAPKTMELIAELAFD
jgi:hypothetical protein